MLELVKDRDSLAGNGSKTEFDFDFYIQKDTDIEVYIIDNVAETKTEQTLDTDYTVENISTGSGSLGFTVSFISATPTNDQEIFAIRKMPFTQLLNLGVVTDYDERKIVNALDKLTALTQQNAQDITRCVKTPDESDTTGLEFPATLTANKAVIINSDGDGLTLSEIDVDDMADYLADAETAATLAQAAVGSIPTVTGNGGKVLRQKATEDGLEYYDLENDFYTETEVDALLANKTVVDVPQTIQSYINGSGVESIETTDSIWELNSGNLTGNKISSGTKITCRKGGVDKVYTFSEDIDLGTLTASRTSHIVLKVKSASEDNLTLAQADVEIIELPQGMWWKEENTEENFELDSGGTIQDKYGNTITQVGDPTIASGVVTLDGNDAFKITSIQTFRDGTWCIDFDFKVDTTSANQYIMSTENVAMMLQLDTTNKLRLFLANASAWDIANGVQGSKNDYNNTTTYSGSLYFTGSHYKLTVDGNEDISVASSTSIKSDIGSLNFGVYSGSNFLTGQLSNIKVTIGNTFHYNGRFDYDGRDVYIGYPSDFTDPVNAVMAIMLGEVTTDGTEVTDVVTYAFNGKTVITLNGVTLDDNELITHNIGAQYKNPEGYFINPSGIAAGYTPAPDTNGKFPFEYGCGVYGAWFDSLLVNTCNLKTGISAIWLISDGTNTWYFGTANAVITVKREDVA